MQTPQDIILKNKAKYIETEILPHLLKIIQRFADLLPPISSIDDYAKEIFNNPEDGGSILLLETFKKELTNFTAEFIGFLQNTYVGSNQNKSIQDLISLVKIDINVLVHGLDKAIDEHISNSETYNSRYLIFKKIVIYFNAIGYCLANMRDEIENFKNKLSEGEYDLENSLKKIEHVIEFLTSVAQADVKEIDSQIKESADRMQVEEIPLIQDQAENAMAPAPMDLDVTREKMPLETPPSDVIDLLGSFLDLAALGKFSQISKRFYGDTIKLRSIKKIQKEKPELNLVEPEILWKWINVDDPQTRKLLFEELDATVLQNALNIKVTELEESFNTGKWEEIKKQFAQSNPLLLEKLSDCYPDSQLSYILKLMALAASEYQMIYLLPKIANYAINNNINCLGFIDCLKNWAEVEGLPVIINIDQVKQAAVLLNRLQSFWEHRHPKVLKQRLKEWIKKEGYDSAKFCVDQDSKKRPIQVRNWGDFGMISILKLPPAVAKSQLPKWIHELLITNKSIAPLHSWTFKQIKQLKEIPCKSLPQLIDDDRIAETVEVIQFFDGIETKGKEKRKGKAERCSVFKSLEKKDILAILQKPSDLNAFFQVKIGEFTLYHFIVKGSNNKFLTSLLERCPASELKPENDQILLKVASFLKSLRESKAIPLISNIDFNILVTLQQSLLDYNVRKRFDFSFLDLLLESLKNLENLLDLRLNFMRPFLEFFAKLDLASMKRFLLILDRKEQLVINVIQESRYDWGFIEKLLQEFSYDNKNTCVLEILTDYTSSLPLIILLVQHCTLHGTLDLQVLKDTLSSLESLKKYDKFIIKLLVKSVNQSAATAVRIEEIKAQLSEKKELLQILVKSLDRFSHMFKDKISSSENPLQLLESFRKKQIKLREEVWNFLEALVSLPWSDSVQEMVVGQLFPTQYVMQVGGVFLPLPPELDQKIFEEMSQYLFVLVKFKYSLTRKLLDHHIFKCLTAVNLDSLFKIKEQNGDSNSVSLLEAFLYLLSKIDLTLLGLWGNLSLTLVTFLEQNQSKIFAKYNEVKKAEQAMAPVANLHQYVKPLGFFPYVSHKSPQQGTHTGFVPSRLSPQQKLLQLFKAGIDLLESPNTYSDPQHVNLQKVSKAIDALVTQLAQQNSAQIQMSSITTPVENKRKEPDSNRADEPKAKKPNTQISQTSSNNTEQGSIQTENERKEPPDTDEGDEPEMEQPPTQMGMGS